tara:strand:+ start:608 stop:1084 length:477 start_codon:yes stop_codon:yes gene_type:complete
MNIEELWKRYGIPILIINVLMYLNSKLGVFKTETYEQRTTRKKKEAMEMISNYMKLPFSIKLIVLSCFIIVTLHGIFEIEKNEKIDTHKQSGLSLKLISILLLVIVGTVNSYVLFKQENNKILKYGYMSYGAIGLFYAFKYFSHKDLRNDFMKGRRKY